MRSLVLYDSLGGNTEKVANRIYGATRQELPTASILKVTPQTELDLTDHDLIFIGSPVIDWLPTRTMINYVRKTMKAYNKQGLIRPAAPIRPGKFGICFGTFAGPHIGKNEARPMTMWLRSVLEHIGFVVLDTWHIVGQFKNKPDLNQNGRLGNIENRPDERDLMDLENRVFGTLNALAQMIRLTMENRLVSWTLGG